MSDIRDRARKILAQIPEPPKELDSKGDTAKQFERLTNTTQAVMQANWDAGGIMTACNNFVSHYGNELGDTKGLGRFTIEKNLRDWGKAEAWVKSTKDNRPQYGDICLFTKIHMSVALEVNGDTWNQVAAGQGGKTKTYDILKRKYGESYVPTDLQGWVDIDKYFGGSAAAAAASAPVFPIWLAGWWKVAWRGRTFYYYFDTNSQVKWTMTAPDSTKMPLLAGADVGSVTVERDSLVTVTWSKSEAVEKFSHSAADGNQMQGKWKDLEPISAVKM